MAASVRTIRLEIELELTDEQGSRFTKRGERAADIASVTAAAAEQAYRDSEFTPDLKEVRWRFDVFNRVTQGGQARTPGEDEEEV